MVAEERTDCDDVNEEFKVRVRTHQKHKKRRARSARVADAGQGNIETVHAPKHIQAADTP